MRTVCFLLLALPLMSACATRSGSSSLRYLNYAPLGPRAAPGLIVMLPGLGDRATHFVQHGLVDTARAQGGWDVIVTDAHFGYYRVGDLVSRLRQDIIGPARALGYRHIWLVGISMGGFGAVSYASRYPDEIEGLILLSPYLGAHEGNMTQIKEAQARENTSVRASDAPPAAVERRVWNYLAEVSTNDRSQIFLAYASEERSPAHKRLANMLDKEHVHVEPGDHKWRAWRPAFELLARDALGLSPKAK